MLEKLTLFTSESIFHKRGCALERLEKALGLIRLICLAERRKLAKEPAAFSADELRSLLRLTRERFLRHLDALTPKMVLKQGHKITTSAMLNGKFFITLNFVLCSIYGSCYH